VDLVDDIDAFFDLRGRVDRVVAQGADVVDAVVGGAVQLHPVHDGGVLDAQTGGTLAAGVAVDGIFTVDGLGQNFGAGGLARSAGANKEVSVGQPAGLHLIFQGLRDMLLTHDLVEGLGTPLAVKRLIQLSHLPKMMMDMALDKTAHPTSNNTICPLRRQPAQIRHPRGTRDTPLNAARFPA